MQHLQKTGGRGLHRDLLPSPSHLRGAPDFAVSEGTRKITPTSSGLPNRGARILGGLARVAPRETVSTVLTISTIRSRHPRRLVSHLPANRWIRRISHGLFRLASLTKTHASSANGAPQAAL